MLCLKHMQASIRSLRPFFKKGNANSKKQGQNDWKFKKQSNKGQKPNSQGKGKAQKGDAGGSEHPNKGCFRCGSMNHWSRSCRTEPHLVQMYQEWKKRENPEAHFIQARVDAVTGEHTVVLPQPVEKPEGGNAMDVDPTNTSGGKYLEPKTGDLFTARYADNIFDEDHFPALGGGLYLKSKKMLGSRME